MYNHTLLNASSVPRSVYEEAYAAGLKDPGNDTLTKWGISSDCTLQKQLGSAAEGTGLAFIVFTQAIVQLPGAPFWSILFFTMLLSLGIGSQIGLMEGMLCTLFDIDIMKRLRKQYVTGALNFHFLSLNGCLMEKCFNSWSLCVLLHRRINILYWRR